jgi:uncharacterized protein (DUF1697 family)
MTGWVALLRGINLGPRNRIPMAGLKATFEAFGAEDVRTYIVSGNVVFRHAKRGRDGLSRELRAAVAADFGVDTPIILRTFAQIQAIAARDPFGDGNAHTYVTFLERAPDALPDLPAGDDRVELFGEDLYLHLPNGMSGATLPLAKLDRAVPGTNRNWRTVTRLAEMAAGS